MARQSKVSPDDFVTAWQKSKTMIDFTKKTGLKASSAYARARYLTKNGVKLQKFPDSRGGARLDFGQLKKLAAELMPEGAVVAAAPKKRASK